MLFKRIKDWATSITTFRTGDVIPVDGPSGTAKMSADKIYYSGNVETLGVTALSSITKVGTYAVPLSYMPNITDLPAYSASASAFLQVEKTNDVPSFIQKITFADGAGVSFWRVLSGGVAQSWKIVSTEVFNINTYKKNVSSYTLSQAIAEVPAHSRRLGLIITFRQAVSDERAYIYTAADTADVHWNNTANWQELLFTSRIENDVQAMGVTALSTITSVGFYQVPLAYMSSITDLPSGHPNVSASLFVRKANDVASIQTITFTDFQSWSRIVSGGTAQPWYVDSVFHGAISALGYTTFAKCDKDGFYWASSTDLPSITDKPSGLSGTSCCISVYSGNANNNLQVLQTLDGQVYRRASSKSAPYSTSAWSKDPMPADLVKKGSVETLGVSSLVSVTDVGFYQVPLAYMSSLNDLPSGHPNVSASMIVERANPAAAIQTITFTDLQSWSRIVSSGTAQEWYKNLSHSVGSRTRFIAMGDSITEGYWADDDGTLRPPTSLNWPYYVGIINNWSVTNAGAGGSGYVHNGTVAPKTKNAVGMVNDVDFSNYDIVSFAWGVNDWHYECNIGDISTSTLNDGTMVGNMRYCVEKVLTDNPKCKIVVVLPFNSSMFGGDFASNWGLGTTLPTSGTLQNVIDKIKSVCEYYGLQMIDSINNSVVNRFNIEDYFPDGLHPAEDGYLQIARCYAKQMMFG